MRLEPEMTPEERAIEARRGILMQHLARAKMEQGETGDAGVFASYSSETGDAGGFLLEEQTATPDRHITKTEAEYQFAGIGANMHCGNCAMYNPYASNPSAGRCDLGWQAKATYVCNQWVAKT